MGQPGIIGRNRHKIASMGIIEKESSLWIQEYSGTVRITQPQHFSKLFNNNLLAFMLTRIVIYGVHDAG